MDKKYVAYAGSYTHESSKGIHIYDCDVAKGRITEREEVAIDNPSFIAFHMIRISYTLYVTRVFQLMLY